MLEHAKQAFGNRTMPCIMGLNYFLYDRYEDDRYSSTVESLVKLVKAYEGGYFYKGVEPIGLRKQSSISDSIIDEYYEAQSELINLVYTFLKKYKNMNIANFDEVITIVSRIRAIDKALEIFNIKELNGEPLDKELSVQATFKDVITNPRTLVERDEYRTVPIELCIPLVALNSLKEWLESEKTQSLNRLEQL